MKNILLLIPFLASVFLSVSCTEQEKDAPAAVEPSEASVPAAPSEVSAPAEASAPAAPAAPSDASAPAKAPESAASAEDAASSASPVSDAAGALSSAGKAAAGGDDPAAKLKEAAGFSKTLTGAWDSMKGMDFSEKAAFVKKGMDLVSKAKDHIGMLKNLAPLLSGDMGKQLMSQVGGLSGNLGDLSGLFGKAGSIGAGDWGSYKDQIGSAIKGLSGGFSGLGSL